MTDVIPLIPEAPATFADDAADIGALAAQGETPPNERNRKSVSQKKLEKRIVRLTGQAVTDFDMIREGDKIMVAMSGGKDSYVLLDTLKILQARAPIHFDLLAVNVHQHIPEFPLEALKSIWNIQGYLFTLRIKTRTRLSRNSFRKVKMYARSVLVCAAASYTG